MKKSKVSVTKKRIGRPAIGIGTQIGMRWRDHELTAIDTWRQNQPDELSRTEAIRRLVEIGLSHSHKRDRLSHEARAKASAMAGEIVDQLTDAAAPVEEQEKRSATCGKIRPAQSRGQSQGARRSGYDKGP
jgi:hypothetical protein